MRCNALAGSHRLGVSPMPQPVGAREDEQTQTKGHASSPAPARRKRPTARRRLWQGARAQRSLEHTGLPSVVNHDATALTTSTSSAGGHSGTIQTDNELTTLRRRRRPKTATDRRTDAQTKRDATEDGLTFD